MAGQTEQGAIAEQGAMVKQTEHGAMTEQAEQGAMAV